MNHDSHYDTLQLWHLPGPHHQKQTMNKLHAMLALGIHAHGCGMFGLHKITCTLP